ncbi:chitinase [Mesorhizobium sp. DCY119]|uniref:chitinase n=1 Tax=Mesorhizobium sp. DCY119 TaxID=2108445 RepID=UPI000E6D5578|nr:chitinase [Mesorhizobium sp. DCY119]RJG46489.1 chitinase [Mesorhizobium sp. DCY119]
MNNTTFFAYARRAPFGGRLSTSQVAGMEAILAEAYKRGTPDQHLAYMLATAFHETGGKMQPVEENLNYSAARIRQVWPTRFASVAAAKPYARNPRALANKVYGGRQGNDTKEDGYRFRGRGLPQITFRDNYRKFGIEANPEKALELATAVHILFDGMTKGMFTTARLDQYFGAGKEDPVGARAIVNGTDKATLIAGYYKNFLDSIVAARDVKTKDVVAEAAKPDDVPAGESKSLMAIGSGLVTSGGLAAFTGGPWGFAALALLLAVGGIGLWLVMSGRVEIKRIKEAL